MWTSKLFCLAGRATSARFVSPPPSRLRCRTFVAPAIAAIDVGNHFPGVRRSENSSANSLNTRSKLLPLHSNAPSCISLPFHETRRFMSKYLSKSAAKRLPLNTKRAKKGYYKGKGGTSEGRLTSKGKFIADPLKKLQLIVPDLEGFALKPYIARAISKTPPEKRRSPGAGQ
mmetsp:Transcript_14444/g.31404  ORF Transcript_14444/g.31404 Transcript_14444/m.31404 type:complete len:172 (-) Transcript_14444:302-817(-)